MGALKPEAIQGVLQLDGASVVLFDAVHASYELHKPDVRGEADVVDGNPVYSCTLLAIEAQGRRIETIEGISTEDSMHPVQVQFVENDAQQCGFCTPGLVMAGKVAADRNPPPSMAEVESALSGNICRCGTYVGVRKAVYEAARQGGA